MGKRVEFYSIIRVDIFVQYCMYCMYMWVMVGAYVYGVL